MSRDTLVTGLKLTALANSIRTKAGIQASMTLDQMKTAVDNISTGGGTDSATLKVMIERSLNAEIVIPDGTTMIAPKSFYGFESLINVFIPYSVTSIGNSAFYNCQSITSVTIAQNSLITYIDDYAFWWCSNITSFIIPHGCTYLGNRAFGNCSRLATITIPNTPTAIDGAPFDSCDNLQDVTLENGFNCNGFNLSVSTQYSANTIVSWLNALADRTGLSAYTLHIGSNNITKLSAAEIAIATNKNWNLD